MADDDVERDPEHPAHIEKRRAEKAALDRRHQERQRELEERYDGIPQTHDDLHNEADYEIEPLWEHLRHIASNVRLEKEGEFGTDGPYILDPLAETIGRARLHPWYWNPGDNATITRYLDGLEATRVYLYLDLSPLPEYRVATKLETSTVRDALGLSQEVSQSTLNRMPGRMDEYTRRYYASETETLVRQWQETPYAEWVREPTPETIAPDGEGVPPVQTLARELRSESFQYIRFKRDKSVRVTKDSALRVLVAAANGNAFANDAAKNLDLKPWYTGREIPTGEGLNAHIRKSKREQITRMFLDANDVLFQIADDHGYFDDHAEVAFDITDWPYYGNTGASKYIRGTKPTRNYGYAWKYITMSLVGTDTPLILMVLPVRKKSDASQYIRRMLRIASQFIDVQRVYLDAGTEFYSYDTLSTIEEFGVEFVMQGMKQGSDIKNMLLGMAHLDLDETYVPYGIGDFPDDAHTAIGRRSEKHSSRRKSEPDDPRDNFVYFYTNCDLDEYSVDELARDYRKRWGIETGYRVIKHEFLPKCGSPSSRVRTFYFNFAAHLYNIWTTANILRADDLDEDLTDGKLITAGRLMQAIEDDPYDLQIPDEQPEELDVFDGLFG